MNWKFWKKKEVEVATPVDEVEALKQEVLKLQLINQMKDQMLLERQLDAQNFKQSAYATLAGIALAHGGEYVLNLDFTNTAIHNGLITKLVIQAQPDNTMKFCFIETEPEEEITEETV